MCLGLLTVKLQALSGKTTFLFPFRLIISSRLDFSIRGKCAWACMWLNSKFYLVRLLFPCHLIRPSTLDLTFHLGEMCVGLSVVAIQFLSGKTSVSIPFDQNPDARLDFSLGENVCGLVCG